MASWNSCETGVFRPPFLHFWVRPPHRHGNFVWVRHRLSELYVGTLKIR